MKRKRYLLYVLVSGLLFLALTHWPSSSEDSAAAAAHEQKDVDNSGGPHKPIAAHSAEYATACRDTTHTAHLPLAPPTFYPSGKQLPTRRNPACRDTDQTWRNECCRTVYFVGSGKCGSTTLAVLLKHNISDIGRHDPTSGFADGEKEPCWGLTYIPEVHFYDKFQQCRAGTAAGAHCDRENRPVVLDACPRYIKLETARRIACANPNAKFVMLIRDPVIRTISDHNDHMIRGNKKSPAVKDRQSLSARSFMLSDYAKILENFLTYFPPENILIVQLEYLKDGSYVQQVMDTITSHYGVRKRPVAAVETNSNHLDAKYTLPPYKSLQVAFTKLCPKTMDFFRLVGYRMDWMLSIADPRAVGYFSSGS